MKKVLLLTLFSYNSFGQIVFQKTYGDSADQLSFYAQQTYDGGYFIAGVSGDGSSGNYDAFLTKTDEYGEIVWTETYGTLFGMNINFAQQASDSGYVLVGNNYSSITGLNDVLIMKTDASGNLAWVRNYDFYDDDVGYCVAQTHDGGYILCGQNSLSVQPDILVIKTNDIGDTVWTKVFGGANIDAAYFIRQTNDNGYIVAGQTSSFSAGLKDAWLIKMDSLGNIQWNKTFGSVYNDIGRAVEQTSDNGFILIGYSGFFSTGGVDVGAIKTDSIGNIQWMKSYGTSDDDIPRSCKQLSSGDYVISGYNATNGSFVLKINSTGNLLWNKLYGTQSISSGSTICPTNDGGFVLGGYYYAPDSSWDAYLIKTDSMGNSGCDEIFPLLTTRIDTPIVLSPMPILNNTTRIVSTPVFSSGSLTGSRIICQTLSSEEPDKKDVSIAIYPNPAHSSFTIQWNEKFRMQNAELKIYDVTGREVHSQAIRNQETEIRNLSLTAGIYFVKVTGDGKEAVQKLLIE